MQRWANTRGYDYRLTDDSVFALCGPEYLAQVGDNKRSITNLCRLELIKLAFAEGYDRAIWMDADVLVFAPERLDFAPTERISFPRETWIMPWDDRWVARLSLNNCVVLCPSQDTDLDLIIHATRQRARYAVTDNLQVGGRLLRGLYEFMFFPLLANVGMFSNHTVMALASGHAEVLHHQAVRHGTPVFAANLCASEHLTPPVPEPMAHAAIDRLEETAGEVINGQLSVAAPLGRRALVVRELSSPPA